jgi:hypothetical protein
MKNIQNVSNTDTKWDIYKRKVYIGYILEIKHVAGLWGTGYVGQIVGCILLNIPLENL